MNQARECGVRFEDEQENGVPNHLNNAWTNGYNDDSFADDHTMRKDNQAAKIVQPMVEQETQISLIISELARQAQTNKLIFAPIHINKHEYSACIDCGSVVLVITKSLHDQLKVPLYPCEKMDKVTASNNILQVCGECDLIVTLKASNKSVIIESPFLVVPYLHAGIQIPIGQNT